MTTAVVTLTVEDAVRSHVSWMTALAGLPGGRTWTDGPVRWAHDGPYGAVHALFPGEMPVDAAREGLERARSMAAAHVAIWSATDVECPELEELGFEVGWQPWWMGRATAGVDEESMRLARRVMPSLHARPSEQARQPLLDRDDVFRIEARADGRYAGHAWGHVRDGAAGLYDMHIRAPFRRRGLGAEVVTAIVAEAGRRGADRVSLNATPQGEKLYAACGFTLLGRGRTWWWHASPTSAAADRDGDDDASEAVPRRRAAPGRALTNGPVPERDRPPERGALPPGCSGSFARRSGRTGVGHGVESAAGAPGVAQLEVVQSPSD